MPKARKNRRSETHTSKKRAEHWFKRLRAAKIEREEERCRKVYKTRRKELGLENNGICEISYSSSHSPIPDRKDLRPEEPHLFSSRAASPITYDNDK
jgi:hypothetical protein